MLVLLTAESAHFTPNTKENQYEFQGRSLRPYNTLSFNKLRGAAPLSPVTPSSSITYNPVEFHGFIKLIIICYFVI